MAKNKNTIEEFFDDGNKTINAEDMLHKNMKVYGLDVLEDRALADYRDGLKPAQRRLMWTAKDLKATWENKTVKSARITGDCFTGDTEILTVNNDKLRIDELEQLINDDKNVYTFSCSDKGNIVVSKIVKCWKKTDTTNIIRVHLDNGTHFDCTPDHKIMTRDGSYKKACELVENESLMPLYFGDETKDGRRTIISNNDGKQIMVYKLSSEHIDCDKSEPKNEGDFFQIHHIDFDKHNDRPDNLKQINSKNHCRIHGPLSLHKYNTEGGLSRRNSDSWKNEEYRNRMSKIVCSSNINRSKKFHEEKVKCIKTLITPSQTLYEMYCKLKKDNFYYIINNVNKFEGYNFTKDIQFLSYAAGDETGNSFKTIMYLLSLKDKKLTVSNDTLLSFKKKHKTTFIGSAKYIVKNYKELIDKLNLVVDLPEQIEYPDEIKGNSRKIQLYNSCYRIVKKLRENSKILNEENWNKLIRHSNDISFKKAIADPIYSNLISNYNHKVLKIEKLNICTPVPVYNIEVDSIYHNFPLGNGVFVKNCMGKFHPHGTAYGSLVTMATSEYPIIYGQGNWRKFDRWSCGR